MKLNQSQSPARIEVTAEIRTPTSDVRSLSRSLISSPCELSWEDSRGCLHTSHARAVDVSESGMRLECFEAIERNAIVNIQATRHGLASLGSVRYCFPKHLRYVIGLQLHTV
jgi:hypothetical protein